MDSIFILPDPEVEKLLADNGIDLVRELQKKRLKVEGTFIEVEGTFRADPTKSGEKDLVLVILASAAAFVAVSQGIVQIINALAASKGAETIEVTTSLQLDADGKPIKGDDGQPLYNTWSRREAAAPVPRDHTSGVEWELMGLKVKLSSGSKAPASNTPP
ncbi:hypothetical protein [Paracoccus benzoatiresistens]|uniref:Uncharacterized protein n=1 Tax=Paracoccus benzoatiresistens TaxID=2997341 RepID=A0ABT4J798_9RHOB|nr:hypothetical protein [Paracoccus sp. EF6]MCZ0962953.1 hypothetical protein [Paracoccus sp. EF6]